MTVALFVSHRHNRFSFSFKAINAVLNDVNTESEPESSILDCGNVRHPALVGFLKGWGIFRFQMGNEEEKKTSQTYAGAGTMKK